MCRLVKARHAASAFDGEGARAHGGRWTSAGTRVVYCSVHPSLAVLEVLVHLEAIEPLSTYVLIRAEFRDEDVEWLDPSALPEGWSSSPAPTELAHIGDEWAAGNRSLALAVPSAVVSMEWNVLLNPEHQEFHRVTIGEPRPFVFDPRLMSGS